MKNLFFLLLLSFGMVSAVGVSICVDLSPPEAPGNLSVSGSVGSILISWDAAKDEPSCSGIAEYVVLRDGVEIGRVSGDTLSFVDDDSLLVGDYSYYVYAVDLGSGNDDGNSGASVVNDVSVDVGGVVRSGGGGGSSECVSNWVCGNWSECVNNEMRRICEDERRCGTDYLRPEESMTCGEVLEEEERFLNMEDEVIEGEVSDGFISSVTGAVIGGGATSVVSAVVVLGLSVAGFAFVVRRRRL